MRPTLFTVLPNWMGSASLAPTVEERAKAAFAEYGSLLDRVGGIAGDEERAAITYWVGAENVPGSPAERASVVGMDLRWGQDDKVLQEKRVVDLEKVVQEFRAKVANAESASGTVTAADHGQVADVSGQPTAKGIAMGVLAIVGFFVLPFTMKS